MSLWWSVHFKSFDTLFDKINDDCIWVSKCALNTTKCNTSTIAIGDETSITQTLLRATPCDMVDSDSKMSSWTMSKKFPRRKWGGMNRLCGDFRWNKTRSFLLASTILWYGLVNTFPPGTCIVDMNTSFVIGVVIVVMKEQIRVVTYFKMGLVHWLVDRFYQ